MKTRSRIRSLFARPDQRTPGKVPHRARPLVEALEGRSVPAVVVTGLGGTLYIFDTDTSGHTIEVDQTATQGAFTVEVDSSSVGTFTGIKNINADLFVDSDTLTFGNPSSATTNLRGDLTVWAAEPADGETVVYENFYAIKGDVSLTEGNGAEDQAYVGYDASVSIGGNLSITQGFGGDDNANVGESSIGGNAFITQGNGTDDQAYVGYGASASFGGNVFMTQGNGADDGVIVNMDSSGVRIGGNLSITQGYGAVDYATVGYGFNNSDRIGGNLSITQGNGADDIAGAGLDAASAAIGGNMFITQGNGTNDHAYVGDDGSASIGGNVFMTQGNGDQDFVVFGAGGPGFKSTIGRNLFLAEGDGNNDEISFDDTTVAGNASFQLGNGSSDVVDIEADYADGVGVTFTKNVSISFGHGGAPP